MIEINSTKIEKQALYKELDKRVESYKKNPNINRKVKTTYTANYIKPSLREYTSKSYILMKRIELILHKIGLSYVVFFLKSILKKINFKKVNVYLVDDFCQYHNEEFIKNVYLGVLKREVDPPAFNYYLDLLLTGKRSKTEILATIRFSKEGRLHDVNILGIKKRYIIAILYRIPVIGYLSKTLITLLTLPRMIEKSNRFEAYYFLNNQLNTQLFDEKVNVTDLNNKLDAMKNIIDEKVNLSDFHKDVYNIENSINENSTISIEYTKNKFNELTKQVNLYAQEINVAKSYLREVESNLNDLISKAQSSMTDSSSRDDNSMLSAIIEEKEHMLDPLYIAFEDKFRGSRADIKQRQEYYLPLVRDVIQNTQGIVVDVGCGRGEWLELLQENEFNAKGIDLNRLMVNESVKYGLDAINKDAIEYLKTLPKDSLSIVTGFHIVEHLPFEILISLFDEAFRVLKKGGMIIFETPNPENIMVGSCSFYTDPTHINPIPPVTLEFLATNRGFTNVNIHRLHPLKEPIYLEGDDKVDANTLIYAATKSQDYSIVGYKI